MDPLTHAALGATIGLGGFSRRLGRRALAAGAIIALSPDADVVVGWFGGPFATWLHHRGLTHSIFWAAIVGPVVGWALWRLQRRRPDELAAWIGLAVAALLTHPLLDLITHYGTQLLAPLSSHRFGLRAMPIVDPVMTTLLALPALIAAVWPWRWGRASAWVALLAAYGYAMFAWSLNDLVEVEARRQLAAAQVPAADVRAYPTILQPYYRRVVVRTADEVLVGFHSLLNPKPIAWVRAKPDDGPAVAAVAATPQAEILAWFADGQLLWRVRGGEVEARDLRYGYPDGSETGMWGIRAVIGADGRLVEPPRIFSERPRIDGQTFARLWRLVFG